jgi:hypothetical protein
MMLNRHFKVAALTCAVALMSGALTLARSGDMRVVDAAMNRDAAAVQALLKQGADVNAAQGDG